MWPVQCPADGVPLAKCFKTVDWRQWSYCHQSGCSSELHVYDARADFSLQRPDRVIKLTYAQETRTINVYQKLALNRMQPYSVQVSVPDTFKHRRPIKPHNFAHVHQCKVLAQVSCTKVKAKGRYGNPNTHLTATGRHLPYGITQCYLPPDTSERARLTSAIQAGTRFTYPKGMEGWVDLVDLIAPRPGVEPATFRSRVW